MTRRIPLLLALLVACPAFGFAQGFSSPRPAQPPVRAPGMRQFNPAFGPYMPGMIRPLVPYGYSPWWYAPSIYAPEYSYPWAYAQPPMVRATAPRTPPPLQGAGGGSPALANPDLPASFTIEFPADVKLWLNGKEVPGDGRTRTLESPTLKSGTAFTFDVRAEWTADGKRYEWDRNLTLSAGEKSRATVARGFLIKE